MPYSLPPPLTHTHLYLSPEALSNCDWSTEMSRLPSSSTGSSTPLSLLASSSHTYTYPDISYRDTRTCRPTSPRCGYGYESQGAFIRLKNTHGSHLLCFSAGEKKRPAKRALFGIFHACAYLVPFLYRNHLGMKLVHTKTNNDVMVQCWLGYRPSSYLQNQNVSALT